MSVTAPLAEQAPASDAAAPDVALAVYVHIPFCATRCTYCAFNTYTGRSAEYDDYVRAVCREIEIVGQTRPASAAATTLYFGGGTPSVLTPQRIGSIIAAVRQWLELAPDAEITLEANPGGLAADYFEQLVASGVNRLSLGMQSADESDLALFARRQSMDDVRQAVRFARSAGFDTVNLDLIYGVPRQTLRAWQKTVEAALELEPDHLSIYSLGVEDGTAMARWIERGTIEAPDADLAADLYERASERFAEAGLRQYEISNWALPGHACRHNVHVWRNRPYLGLGAGAHGCAGGLRTVAVMRPDHYIARLRGGDASSPFPLTPATDEAVAVSTADAMAETLFLGLRLTEEGVSSAEFRSRFGVDVSDAHGEALRRLHEHGLLRTTDEGSIVLTPRARLLANLVFAEFV